MSIIAIRAGSNQALAALADASLVYRAGTSGAWIALPGAILNTDPPVSIGFDDDEGGEVQMQTGSLVCQFATVALDIGHQVRDFHSQVWAVVGIDRAAAAVIYRLKRERLSDAAYDGARGGKE